VALMLLAILRSLLSMLMAAAFARYRLRWH